MKILPADSEHSAIFQVSCYLLNAFGVTLINNDVLVCYMGADSCLSTFNGSGILFVIVNFVCDCEFVKKIT